MSLPMVKRIARYLGKRENALDFSQIHDPRARRGRRWSLRSLLTATFVSMVAMEKSFRGVERLTDDLSGCRKRFGIPRRVPDSTLANFYARLDDEAGLRAVLIEDIKRALRRKALEPTELSISAAALDGKTIWCGRHEVDDPACQKMPQESQDYFRLHTFQSRAGGGRRTVGVGSGEARLNRKVPFAGCSKDEISALLFRHALARSVTAFAPTAGVAVVGACGVDRFEAAAGGLLTAIAFGLRAGVSRGLAAAHAIASLEAIAE